MGKSKLRKNHKQKLAARQQQEALERRRMVKALEKVVNERKGIFKSIPKPEELAKLKDNSTESTND